MTPASLDALLIRNPATTFFARMEGERMLAFGIHDGDLLVLEKRESYSPGELVLAFVGDKRLVMLAEEVGEEVVEVFGRVNYSIRTVGR